MRILLISNDARLAERGGLNDVQFRHVAYASRLGHLDIIVRDRSGPSAEPFGWGDNVEIHPVPCRSASEFVARAAARATSVIRKSGVDAVSSQDPFATGLVGLILKKLKKVPLNVQLHSDELDNPYFLRASAGNRIYNLIGKRVLKSARTVRVVNRKAIRYCEGIGILPKACFYIPLVHGLDPFFAAREAGMRSKLLRGDHGRSAPGNKPGHEGREKIAGGERAGKIVLYVGRLAPEKGWAALLEAMGILNSGRSDLILVIVGSGKDKRKMERAVEQMRLADRVLPTGWQPYAELPRYYAAADVCVVPSHHEGFGRSILEAQAAGRPVVATETAGATDLIRHERTGILVPIDDPVSLAGAMDDLLNHKEKSDTIGRRAGREARQAWGDYNLPLELARLFEKTAAMR